MGTGSEHFSGIARLSKYSPSLRCIAASSAEAIARRIGGVLEMPIAGVPGARLTPGDSGVV
jgi:hypothetical protein